MISQKKDWYFYCIIFNDFFLQKFKEDTNVHLAKVQIKRGREPMSYYLITFICSS